MRMIDARDSYTGCGFLWKNTTRLNLVARFLALAMGIGATTAIFSVGVCHLMAVRARSTAEIGIAPIVVRRCPEKIKGGDRTRDVSAGD